MTKQSWRFLWIYYQNNPLPKGPGGKKGPGGGEKNSGGAKPPPPPPPYIPRLWKHCYLNQYKVNGRIAQPTVDIVYLLSKRAVVQTSFVVSYQLCWNFLQLNCTSMT